MRDFMPEEVYIALDRDGKFKSMDDVLSETSPGVDDFVHFFYHHKDDQTSTVGQVTWFMTDDPNDPRFRMVFYKFNADFHMSTSAQINSRTPDIFRSIFNYVRPLST